MSLNPPDTQIKSARARLHRPPTWTSFLAILHNLESINVPVTISFRIVTASACEEENKEDIVYIEAILPEAEEVFPKVHVMEKTDTGKGNHKLTRFLVSTADYMKLVAQQKHQFGLS